MTRYSPHFLRSELLVTSHDEFPNVPTPEHERRLRLLCWSILEPLRARLGPIIVTSGYRSPDVNRAAKGVKSSRHTYGDGVDAKARDARREVLWAHLLDLMEQGLPVRQAIVYEASKHVHIEMLLTRPVDPARQLLVKPRTRWSGRLYVPWDEYLSRGHTLPPL